MSALRERLHVSLNAPCLLGGGGERQLNHVSCEIYGSPEQGVVVFLDSLKSTGTDESAQNDNVYQVRQTNGSPETWITETPV